MGVFVGSDSLAAGDGWRDVFTSERLGWQEGISYSLDGVKISLNIRRDLTENDREALREIGEKILDVIDRESFRVDPAVMERARVTRLEIGALFPAQVFIEEIPNEYCTQACCSQYPWFIVTTQIGRFKIGWRKSVIHIEWSDTVVKVGGCLIFPDQDVTKGDHYVHAHGYEKAKLYINRIYAAAH